VFGVRVVTSQGGACKVRDEKGGGHVRYVTKAKVGNVRYVTVCVCVCVMYVWARERNGEKSGECGECGGCDQCGGLAHAINASV
jgi:hypothetical protein